MIAIFTERAQFSIFQRLSLKGELAAVRLTEGSFNFPLKKALPRETLRKEVVSLGFYLDKTNDTLHKDCESVLVGYIL